MNASPGEGAVFGIYAGRSASARAFSTSWRGVDGGKANAMKGRRRRRLSRAVGQPSGAGAESVSLKSWSKICCFIIFRYHIIIFVNSARFV